jgi:hypothetical protein
MAGATSQSGPATDREAEGDALQVTRTSERQRGCTSLSECLLRVLALGWVDERSGRSKTKTKAPRNQQAPETCTKQREKHTVYSKPYILSIGAFVVRRSLFLRAQGLPEATGHCAAHLPHGPPALDCLSLQSRAGTERRDDHERGCAEEHANIVRSDRRGVHRTGRRGRPLCLAPPGATRWNLTPRRLRYSFHAQRQIQQHTQTTYQQSPRT